MENKKEDFDCFEIPNYTNPDDSWNFCALAILIMALIFNPSFGKNDKNETETRLAKVEAKTEILEKIILK